MCALLCGSFIGACSVLRALPLDRVRGVPSLPRNGRAAQLRLICDRFGLRLGYLPGAGWSKRYMWGSRLLIVKMWR
jgi:hypothetical protein